MEAVSDEIPDDAPPDAADAPPYARNDKIRAGVSLALGLLLIGIAVDVLAGGRFTGRLRSDVPDAE